MRKREKKIHEEKGCPELSEVVLTEKTSDWNKQLYQSVKLQTKFLSEMLIGDTKQLSEISGEIDDLPVALNRNS